MKPNVSLWLGSCLLALAACTSSSESANRDAMTANVGVYDTPGPGIQRVRLGVPNFDPKGKLTADMNEVAADQLISLAVNTERFDVMERAQLDQLLKEQSLEGIVRGDELAQAAQVKGVDYLLIGKITNFKVKAEKTSKGFNLGSLPIPGTGGALGLFDINDKNSRIQVDVGVDLRLVDPSTGQTPVSNFSEYQRVDSLGAMGVSILGANAKADANLEVDADSQGKILRLALDDCIRKMLPKIDRTLRERAKASKAAENPAGAVEEVAPAGGQQGSKFCTNCGKPLKDGAKFCTDCGTKTGN